MLAALAVLVACGPRPEPASSAEPVDATPAPTAAPVIPTAVAPAPEPLREPGVAHTAQIDRVALAPDGSAAITRDAQGSLRLWPALDGSLEPQIVPVPAANEFSVARRPDGKFTVFTVDGAGGAKLLRLDAHGRGKARADLPPFAAVIEGHVLPGGEHVLVLFKDRTIKLLDDGGKEVAAFDERRFRPDRLELSTDGTSAVAVIEQPSTGGGFKSELVRLGIVAGPKGKAKIERRGSPRLISTQIAHHRAASGLSNDGGYFAVPRGHENGAWKIEVHDLKSGGDPRVVSVEMTNRSFPGLGFAAQDKLLVTPNDGSLGALIDLTDDTRRPRSGPPQDFNHQGRAQDIRGGRQIFAYGTWLFVHDADSGAHRFLGYDTASAQAIAVSPDGKHVAWGFNTGPMRVEPIRPTADDPGVEMVVADHGLGPWKLRFIDDDHVIAADTATNLVLYHWRSRREIARVGVVGSIRNIDYDPVSGLLAVDRHNNDIHVFEASAKGLVGPYLVADGAYRFGLLTPKSENDAVLWTLSASNRWREYSRKQVEADLTTKAVEAMGEALATGQPAPLAVDRNGRHYGLRSAGSGMEVFVDLGDELLGKRLENNDVSQMVVSPDASRIALVSARTGTTLSVRDTKTLEEIWTFGVPSSAPEVVWSPDSRSLGIASGTGALLLDAKTGRPLRRRCGLRFEVVGAPPPTAFNNLGQRSACEG